MRGIEQIPWLYDVMMSLFERLGFRQQRLDLVSGSTGRVLEIGSGTGRNLRLYEKGVDLVAVEPDLSALVASRVRRGEARLLAAAAENLPFRAGVFDAVVSSLVFCSVDEPATALGEIVRALRKGGELRMIEHVRSDRPLLGAMQDGIQPLWTAVAGGCHPNRRTAELVASQRSLEIDEAVTDSRGVMRKIVARRHNDLP